MKMDQQELKVYGKMIGPELKISKRDQKERSGQHISTALTKVRRKYNSNIKNGKNDEKFEISF